ncbi:MAG TPA: hypothetical protein PKE29_10295 [Phycisphaerales bacterium]|nr:hypothetical protein [Phycisphaerales bacterium]
MLGTPPTPTTARALAAPFLPILAAALAVCVGLMPARARADSVIHTSVAHLQQNIRADSIVEPFNGPDNFALPAPFLVGGNGYAFSVDAFGFGLARFAYGIGNASPTAATRFTFTGKPVSAFGGTFRVVNLGLASIGGAISIATNTGETATLIVDPGAAGSFFAITTTRPFTSVTIDTVPPGGNNSGEFIDDVYVGTSGACPTAADFCPDAMTVGLGAYPFTTVGAGRYLNSSACNTESTSPDVYFRFVPAATGLATASTCGCDFDSILRVFAACPGGAGGGGDEIACNDDACNTSQGFSTASRVSFRVVAGQAVIIRIAGYLANSGSGTLTIAEVADCPADFNHTGSLEVADIFDFLNGWFAGCP